MIKSTYCLELILILLNIVQQQKLIKKGHTDRDLEFEKKGQEALEKKLNCTFIRIKTSKENFDIDYEAGRNTNVY